MKGHRGCGGYGPRHRTKMFAAGILLLCAPLSSQDGGVVIKYHGGGNYTLVERTDLRRYDNGRYTGLVSREVRSFIAASPAPTVKTPQMRDTDTFYDGDFYIKEETMKDRRKASGTVNTSIPAAFRITANGDLVMMEDNGYPSFRSFPAYSTSAVQVGDKWRSDAVQAVDPLGKGVITRMPIHVEYTYQGNDVWNGQDVFVLQARWATRYGGIHSGSGEFGGHVDTDGDPALLRAEGSHDAKVFVSRSTGAALLVKDKVDETYIYDKGQAVSFKGSIALFTEYPPSVDRDSIIPALERAGIEGAGEVAALGKKGGAGGEDGSLGGTGGADGESADGLSDAGGTGGKEDGDGTDDIGGGGEKPLAEVASAKIASSGDGKGTGGGTDEGISARLITEAEGEGGEPRRRTKVEDTKAGLRLTIEDLRFLPDSAQLLPEERGRVAAIASVLREVPEAMFLVEGHTASTGRPAGEQKLSLERARTIAESLAAYGIEASRFICKGSGGKKPVAPNDTPQGKAQNRRVEITILE